MSENGGETLQHPVIQDDQDAALACSQLNGTEWSNWRAKGGPGRKHPKSRWTGEANSQWDWSLYMRAGTPAHTYVYQPLRGLIIAPRLARIPLHHLQGWDGRESQNKLHFSGEHKGFLTGTLQVNCCTQVQRSVTTQPHVCPYSLPVVKTDGERCRQQSKRAQPRSCSLM